MQHREIDASGFRAAVLADQAAPVLLWVPVADLVIDPRYQREISGKGRWLIQRIADAWSWQKYQPILISAVGEDRYAVVDGQHRAHAAVVCGIRSLPAMVVPMTLAEQAASFAAVNRDRVAMSAQQIYRAELAAGAGWAVAVQRAVAEGGCEMMRANQSTALKRPGQVYAVTLIRRMVEAGEGAAVTAGLRAIRDSQAGSEIISYQAPVLAVWLRALARNQVFLRLDLPSIFDEIDFEGLDQVARAWARARGGSPRALATDHVAAILSRARSEAA